MKKLRVCIIGKGYGLKILFPIFDSYKNVNIVGLSSKTIKKNDVLKIKKPLTTFSSWKIMILECFPDLVVVATPPYEQSKIIFFLIKNKIPFFAEKPLTHNFITAKKIFLTIKKINLPAVIDFNFISLPIFSEFRNQMIEKIQAGLALSENKKQKMGEEARNCIKNKFDKEIMLENYLKFYKKNIL